MATWNADKPALANALSADVPDIEENLQELHDVITAITNGTLGTTAPTSFEVDVIADETIDSDHYVDGSIDAAHLASNAVETAKIKDANVTAAKLVSDICIKGWIQFNGSGTVAIQDSYNVTSITDNSTGNYTVTWDTDFANDDYAATINANPAGGWGKITAMAVGTVTISCTEYDSNAATDAGIVSVIAIGDQ